MFQRFSLVEINDVFLYYPVASPTADLEKEVRKLYAKVVGLEEEKYDWEDKIRKQEYEVGIK